MLFNNPQDYDSIKEQLASQEQDLKKTSAKSEDLEEEVITLREDNKRLTDEKVNIN